MVVDAAGVGSGPEMTDHAAVEIVDAENVALSSAVVAIAALVLAVVAMHRCHHRW